jgi:hypothetical protein
MEKIKRLYRAIESLNAIVNDVPVERTGYLHIVLVDAVMELRQALGHARYTGGEISPAVHNLIFTNNFLPAIRMMHDETGLPILECVSVARKHVLAVAAREIADSELW